MEERTQSAVSYDLESNEGRRAIVIHANYELFIVALLILQLINSVLWILLSDPDQQRVIQTVGGGIAAFLLIDILYRVIKAYSKKRFFLEFYAWLAVLGSLPIPFFSLFRLIWYTLAARKLKKDDFGLIKQVVVEQRARSALLSVFLLAIVVVEIASLLIIKAEIPAADANIHTASDAIWWSLVTIATVGYGDKYPVTNPGRIVGIGLMIVGVGLFGVFTSYLAQWFITPKKRLPFVKGQPPEDQDLDELRGILGEIQRKLDLQANSHQESTAGLLERLEAIEKRLGENKPANPNQE
jgi:voltage-gated potassium channel